MSRNFGDAVVLIRKSPDGKVISRVNAVVLSSTVQSADINSHHSLKDHRGALPQGEYLELLFPRDFPYGPPRARDLDVLFQRAVSVPQWQEGAFIGWEVPGLPSAEDLDVVAEEKKTAEASSEASTESEKDL